VMSLGASGAWEGGRAASIRESGNLTIGVVLSSARETPEGAPMHSPRRVRPTAACHLRVDSFIILLAAVALAALRRSDIAGVGVAASR